MSAGLLPDILATVTTVGPTIYGLVDAYQQRKRENRAAALPQGSVPPTPTRAEWVVPVVSAVVASGGVSYLLWWWYKKQKRKGKKGRKRSNDDE